MPSGQELSSQLADWIVGLMSPDAEPSPTRDYYFVLLQRGRGVPEAVRMTVDDLLEEVRSAVSREESYNARTHRARLGLPSYVPFHSNRLPREVLVRRIVQERSEQAGPSGTNRPQRRGT